MAHQQLESEFTDLLSTLPSSSSSTSNVLSSASANLLRTKALRDEGHLTLSITQHQQPASSPSKLLTLPTESELRKRGGVKLRTTEGAGLLGAGLLGGLLAGGSGESGGMSGKGGRGGGNGKGKAKGKVIKRVQKGGKHKGRKGKKR